MALADAIRGARKRTQTITWTDDGGTAINLTGATITGKLRNRATGLVAAIDGTLALVTAASGIFSWAYGANDVAVDGEFDVTFTATYGDTLLERTYASRWKVHEAVE